MRGRAHWFICLILVNLLFQPLGADTGVHQIPPEDVDSVELLIATPSRASMASVAGHLYLLFRFKEQIDRSPLVMGFEADTRGEDEQDVSAFLFSMRGLLGHYRTMIDVEPLAWVVFRSTIIQDRNLYRLKLDFNPGQINRLIDHIRTYQSLEKGERFYFLNQNCSTFIRWLINRVLDKKDRMMDLDLVDLPLNMARKVYDKGLGDFAYPEYWSISRRFNFARRRNRALINGLSSLSEYHPRLRYLPAIIDICRKLTHITNPLGRRLLYQNLYQRFSTLFDDYGLEPNLRKSLYQTVGYLLINYRDIERFFTYQGLTDKDGLRQLADLDSKNVIFLTTALDQCRLHFSAWDREFWHSMVNSWKDERSNEAKKYRRLSVPLPSYSVATLQLGALNRPGDENTVAFSIKYSLMAQPMGDRSIFTQSHSTQVELLSCQWTSYSPAWRSVEVVLLDLDKVIPAPRLNYTGFINSGYGFSFFRLTTHPHPRVKSHLKLADGRFVLGLFENGGFRHFLNISSGLGYSLTHVDTGALYHGLSGTLKLSGKIQLRPLGPWELRLKSELNHILDLKEFSFTLFNTDLALRIPLSKRTGTSFMAGMRWYYSYLNHGETPEEKHTFFTLYTGLRLSTDRLFQILF